MNRKSPLAILAIFLLGSSALIAEVAHSPDVPTYVSWEPFATGAQGLGSGAFNNIVEQVDAPHTQGYHLFRRFKSVQGAPDFGDCTRSNWDAFARAVGIALITTHGFPHSIIGVSTNDLALADQWVADGTDNAGLEARFSTQFNCYVVRVRSGWFERNFATFFNASESIVFLNGCETAIADKPNEKEIFNAVGGRFAIGFTNKVGNRTAANDIKRLLLFMNGLEPSASPGILRLASLAAAAPGYSSGFTTRLSGETTLCPAVAKPTVSNISPVGSGAATSGDGKIVFDTKVDAVHIVAKDALTFSVSGTVDITNVRWNGDHEIDFHWNAQGSSGGYVNSFSVTATALASKIVAFPGGQNLDGGDLSGSETNPDGFAPNGDNFIWKFSN